MPITPAPTIPFAVQVPSLVNLRKRLRAERGEAQDVLPVEVVDALCVLAQAAYEDWVDYVVRTEETPHRLESQPVNPGNYRTVISLASSYAGSL